VNETDGDPKMNSPLTISPTIPRSFLGTIWYPCKGSSYLAVSFPICNEETECVLREAVLLAPVSHWSVPGCFPSSQRDERTCGNSLPVRDQGYTNLEAKNLLCPEETIRLETPTRPNVQLHL
jgi:hypothetical protein